MRFLKIAGLALASMLVAGMALAGNAAATLLWLLCLEGSNSGNTKYEDNQCQKGNAGGKWESVSLGNKSVTVRIQAFSVRLADTKTAVGVSAIKCDGVGSEKIGVLEGTKGLIKEWKVKNPQTNCARVEGACKAGEIEAMEGVNFPWAVEAFETESKFLSKVERGPGAAGEPGLRVECNTLLGKESDTCTTKAGRPEMVVFENVVISGVLLVKGGLTNISSANCTKGGTGSGEASGFGSGLLENGNGFSINRS